MKRILHSVIRRGKKHHKKHLGFLKVLRFLRVCLCLESGIKKHKILLDFLGF